MADAIYRQLCAGMQMPKSRQPAVSAPRVAAAAAPTAAIPGKKGAPTRPVAALTSTSAARPQHRHGGQSSRNQGDDDDDDDDDDGASPSACSSAMSSLYSAAHRQPAIEAAPLGHKKRGSSGGASDHTSHRGSSATTLSGSSSGSGAESAAASQWDEEVRAFRRRLGIHVTGVGVIPDPITSFDMLVGALGADAAAKAGAAASSAATATAIPGALETVASASCVRLDEAAAQPNPALPHTSGKARGTTGAAAPAPTSLLHTRVRARHAAVVRALLAVAEASAYKEPTAVQMVAVPALLAGRDVLACAPTGSGKTAAFLLPIIAALQGHAPHAGPRAILLAPTKELAGQLLREAKRLSAGTGLKASLLSPVSAGGAVEAGAASAGGGTGKRAKMGATGSGGAAAPSHRVSATVDAPDLVRMKVKHRFQQQAQAVAAEAAAAVAAATITPASSASSSGSSQSGKRGADKRSGSSKGSDAALHPDDGLSSEEEEDGEEGSGGDSSAGQSADSSGAASPTPHLPSREWVAPPLPANIDILVATPLGLVALMRHTQARYAVSAAAPSSASHGGASDGSSEDGSSSGGASEGEEGSKDGTQPRGPSVVLPSLRFLVLDEADSLLETGFLEQVDEVLAAARPGGGSPQDGAAAVEVWAREEEAELRAIVSGNDSFTPSASSAGVAAALAQLKHVGAVRALLRGPGGAAGEPGHRVLQIAMFSATVPPGVEELALSVLQEPLR